MTSSANIWCRVFIVIEDYGLKESNASFSRSIIPLFGISEIILEIHHTDLILSEATSLSEVIADTAVSLSEQHDGGYFMVYPRASRQALIARL